MKSEDYIVIQGWMYDIPLTQTQRVVYAIIWGFSRDGRSVYRGTAQMLAEWTGIKRRQAMNVIRQLEDMGLVDHRVVAVQARGSQPGGVMSEFWAVLPEGATRPEKGSKSKINWAGGVVQSVSKIAQPGSATDCTTPYTGSNKNIHTGGGGKNSARRARKEPPTTTPSLFVDEDGNLSGLPPGDPAPLEMPFTEPYFLRDWGKLISEPQWQGKTRGQLQQQLDRFRDCGDVEACCYAIDVAIRRGWDFINDPTKIGIEDMDKFHAFVEAMHARGEGVLG